MTDRQLRRLSRGELLDLLLVQQEEIERLQAELEAANQKLADRRVRLARAGDLASASVALTSLFEEAQRAADIYLENVRAFAGERADSCAESERDINEKI